MVKILLTWCPSTALMGALAQSCCSASLQRGRSSSCKPSPRNARVIWTQIQTHWVSLDPSCSIKRHLGHTGGFQGSVQGVTICSQSVMETHLRYHHSFKIKYFFYCGYSQPVRDNAHIPDASSTLSMKTTEFYSLFPCKHVLQLPETQQAAPGDSPHHFTGQTGLFVPPELQNCFSNAQHSLPLGGARMLSVLNREHHLSVELHNCKDF